MTTKFLSSSGASLDLSSGIADLYIRSLRIADVAPSDNLQTNSYNKVISTSETHTNNEIVFIPDGFSDYHTVGWGNGLKSTDIQHNNTVVSKPTNTLKSYAYGEAVFDPSHQDFDIKFTLNGTPEDGVNIVLGTNRNTMGTTTISDYGTSVIKFELGSGIRQVQGYDLFSSSHAFTKNYTTNGVHVNDTFEFICENGVIKVYYKGLTITDVPQFKVHSGTTFYVGIQDPSTASGHFNINGVFRSKARTLKMKTSQGKLKVTDQADLDILTMSDEKVHTSVKLSGHNTYRVGFKDANSRVEVLSKNYNYVILDSSSASDYCTLKLPDLATITESYMLFLFRVGGREIRVFPQGVNKIDNVGNSSYISMGSDYTSIQLYVSVESNGGKMFYLHSENEGKQYDSYQKGIIATTTFVTNWTGSIAATFKKVNAGFDLSFTALSPKYELIFYCYLDDGNSSSTATFQFDIYNTATSSYDLSAGGINAKFDENDEMTKTIKLFMLNLTVGQTYNIELHGKASIVNNSFYIRSGGSYPESSLFIRPLYNITTF